MFKRTKEQFSRLFALLWLIPALTACEATYEGRTVSQWIKVLETGDTDDKINAIVALRELGPKADAAISALIDALTDKNHDVGMVASGALGKIGKAAIPALIAVLMHENEWVPVDTIEVLTGEEDWGRIKATSDENLLTRENEWFSIDTAEVLSEDLEKEETPDELVSMVNVHSRVSTALRVIGKDAVPALIEVLEHRDAGVRRIAALTLGKIGPDAKPATQALIETINDENDRVRKEAAFALSKIDPSKYGQNFNIK